MHPKRLMNKDSILSRNRAKLFDVALLLEIMRVTDHSCIGRKVGSITADLYAAKRSDLLERFAKAVKTYNETIGLHNEQITISNLHKHKINEDRL